MSGYWSGECLGPGNFMCSPGACFHNFGRNRFCRRVLCSSENYSCLQSYTCLLLIHQVRVSIRIGFHEFKAYSRHHKDLVMKGFLHEPFALLKIALGLAFANLGCCLRNHEQTLMCTKACFRGKAFALFYVEFTKPRSGMHYSTLQP